jgi:hypothetical protein
MLKDRLSQRILASLLGTSAVIIASAALIFTLNHSFTATAADNPVWDDGLRGAVGLGIKDNTGYFVVWGNPNLFYKVDLNKAQDWYGESKDD